MGVQTCTIVDQTSDVAPARLFKAFCLDNHNCMPKAVPLITSMDFLEGDSTVVGCVKQMNFAEGAPIKYVKSKMDEIDEKNFSCKYTNFEGQDFNGKVEYSVNEVKIEPSGTGSHITLISHFHTKGDVVLTEEEIKFLQMGMAQTHECVEKYLLDNPQLYA